MKSALLLFTLLISTLSCIAHAEKVQFKLNATVQDSLVTGINQNEKAEIYVSYDTSTIYSTWMDDTDPNFSYYLYQTNSPEASFHVYFPESGVTIERLSSFLTIDVNNSRSYGTEDKWDQGVFVGSSEGKISSDPLINFRYSMQYSKWFKEDTISEVPTDFQEPIPGEIAYFFHATDSDGNLLLFMTIDDVVDLTPNTAELSITANKTKVSGDGGKIKYQRVIENLSDLSIEVTQSDYVEFPNGYIFTKKSSRNIISPFGTISDTKKLKVKSDWPAGDYILRSSYLINGTDEFQTKEIVFTKE